MINIDTYLNVLKEYNITQAQYIFLYLTRYPNKELTDLYKNMFPTEDKTLIGLYNQEDLVVRGFLRINEGRYYITVKCERLFISNNDLGNEIWGLYPTRLKKVNKRQFDVKYRIAVNYCPIKHEKVKAILIRGLKEKIIYSDIMTFIISLEWLEIEKELKKIEK